MIVYKKQVMKWKTNRIYRPTDIVTYRHFLVVFFIHFFKWEGVWKVRNEYSNQEEREGEGAGSTSRPQ